MIAAIGRIVHYVSYGTPGGEHPMACRAAIITEVAVTDGIEHSVGLAVLNPTGLFLNRAVPRLEDATLTGGTWHFYQACPMGPAEDQGSGGAW